MKRTSSIEFRRRKKIKAETENMRLIRVCGRGHVIRSLNEEREGVAFCVAYYGRINQRIIKVQFDSFKSKWIKEKIENLNNEADGIKKTRE